MKKSLCLELAGEIRVIPENIKAEIIIAGLLDAGIIPEDIQVEHNGTFSRPYRKDLLAASYVEGVRNNYALKLQLSRNGIYDLLPEALSHVQQVEDLKSGEERPLAEGYKRRKKEEAAARKFYRPFETEIFMQRVRLEQEEQKLLCGPSSVFSQFLSDFWGVEGELPPKYEAVLLHLLPYVHAIAGDFNKIETCLEIILGIKVAHMLDFRTLEFSSGLNELGKGKLGDSFTLGSCVHAVPFLVFTFGPIEQIKLMDFLPGGEVNSFLQKFFAYTLPLEVELEINFLSLPYVPEEGGSSFGVLGYSSTL